MAMKKDEFNKVLRNKTLNELEDWCFDWYDKYQKKVDECEKLRKRKESDAVKETNKKLREQIRDLEGKIKKIQEVTNPK